VPLRADESGDAEELRVTETESVTIPEQPLLLSREQQLRFTKKTQCYRPDRGWLGETWNG
jgi:hypothetical protein